MIQFGQKLQEDVQYWVTSDMHFSHKNILKFHPESRPFTDVEQMNEKIIEQWNNTVDPEDVVFHLGDFTMAGQQVAKDILERLNGHIVHVLGNHDKGVNSLPVNKFHYLEVRYKKQLIVMSHYPMRAWNGGHRGSIMLFGHCHGSLTQPAGRTMDVGYDANYGGILPLDLVQRTLNNRDIVTEDGH